MKGVFYMGKKAKFSIQEKERIILGFLNNKISSNMDCQPFFIQFFLGHFF